MAEENCKYTDIHFSLIQTQLISNFQQNKRLSLPKYSKQPYQLFSKLSFANYSVCVEKVFTCSQFSWLIHANSTMLL